MRHFILILLLSCLYLPLAGQVFTYHISGEAYLRENNQLKKLSAEQKIGKKHMLLLKEGAQVVLFNQPGQRISLNKPGTYSYNSILSEFSNNETGLTQAYLGYLWKRLNKKKKAPEQLASRPLGGVARGTSFQLLAPADSMLVPQAQLSFRWQGNGDAYSFTLADAAGNPLLRLETPATTLTIDFNNSLLPGNKVYQWWVQEAGAPAAKPQMQSFILLDESMQQAIDRQLAQIDGITGTATPTTEGISSITTEYLRAWVLEQIGTDKE